MSSNPETMAGDKNISQQLQHTAHATILRRQFMVIICTKSSSVKVADFMADIWYVPSIRVEGIERGFGSTFQPPNKYQFQQITKKTAEKNTLL